MDAKQKKKYIYDRKLHRDAKVLSEQEQLLNKVIIHNALTTKEVETLLKDHVKYYPPCSTEAHFWIKNKGEIHVVNPRGVTRKKRDIDLVKGLSKILGRKLELEVKHYKESSVEASRRFEEFAYELVKEIFDNIDHEKTIEHGQIFLILGPHKAYKFENVLFEKQNDYLNCKIINNNGHQVIYFDYIFADQAKNILEHVYSIVSSYYKNVDVNVFHYGKIGSIKEDVSVGDVCLPIAALDENKVINGDTRAYPIHNKLVFSKKSNDLFKQSVGNKVIHGITINTTSVLNQSFEVLRQIKNAGGDFLEMEWSVMASLDHGYHSNYPNLGKINYYFAGIVSDKPLDGKTLADTKYPAEKMRKIVKSYIKIITLFTS